jgi:NAD+ dependent glucose-6-phosphate dehydrogenase
MIAMNTEDNDIKDLKDEPEVIGEGSPEIDDNPKSWEQEDEWKGAADSALKILQDDDDSEEFDDLEDLEEGQTQSIRTILITGARGNIARKLRDAWEDIYDLVLIDAVADDDDPEVIEADLSVWDQNWVDLFADVDTVIHLAGNRDEFSAWHEVADPNIDAFANVLNAAILNEVERFVFASSNHVMGGYRDIEDIPITVDLPPKPDSPYGGTKLMGERLGKASADAFGMTFLALRIGWVQDGLNDPETLPDEWARLMWLSNDDMIQLFECAVEADLGDREFLVVNGMSNNSGMRWDLGPATEWLGFQPEDDSNTTLDDVTDVV